MKPLDRTDRQDLYEDRTDHTGWAGLAVWDWAFWSTDPDDEVPPFGGHRRNLWDRSGIYELTGLGPAPKQR